MSTTNNTITYKGYTIHIRHDSQTKRANGYTVITSTENYFFETLARAKSFINAIKE